MFSIQPSHYALILLTHGAIIYCELSPHSDLCHPCSIATNNLLLVYARGSLPPNSVSPPLNICIFYVALDFAVVTADTNTDTVTCSDIPLVATCNEIGSSRGGGSVPTLFSCSGQACRFSMIAVHHLHILCGPTLCPLFLVPSVHRQ